LGVTLGAYDQTFSLLDSTFYNSAFVTANGGTVAGAEAALIAAIEGEHTYFNIHTSNFPNGEIRAELLPIAAVPGPHRRCRTARSARGVRRPSRLVATAEEDRLNFQSRTRLLRQPAIAEQSRFTSTRPSLRRANAAALFGVFCPDDQPPALLRAETQARPRVNSYL
jgi:CHRD domain